VTVKVIFVKGREGMEMEERKRKGRERKGREGKSPTPLLKFHKYSPIQVRP